MDNRQTKEILFGTWGQVWLDGDLVAETYKMQAKPGPQGKGSVGLYKVSSRMARLIGEQIRRGHEPRFTIISKLAGPDDYGAERVAVKSVSFDGLTLADWEAAVFGKVECPFDFESYELMDCIQ